MTTATAEPEAPDTSEEPETPESKPAPAPKRSSEPLLEPSTYAEHDVDRLVAERTTISNRMSGVRTQLGRTTDDKKRRALEKRQRDLISRRDKVTKAITAKRGAQA